MDEKELTERIRALLAERSVITLSIADEGGPWAAPMFFAADGFDLYFVSNPGSRHCRSIGKGSTVSAAAHGPGRGWREITGLQMEGVAAPVEGKRETARARRCYVGKFPFTEIFFRQEDQLEPEIRDRIAGIRFYRLRPTRIRLIDNSVRFGFHAELEIE